MCPAFLRHDISARGHVRRSGCLYRFPFPAPIFCAPPQERPIIHTEWDQTIIWFSPGPSGLRLTLLVAPVASFARTKPAHSSYLQWGNPWDPLAYSCTERQKCFSFGSHHVDPLPDCPPVGPGWLFLGHLTSSPTSLSNYTTFVNIAIHVKHGANFLFTVVTRVQGHSRFQVEVSRSSKPTAKWKNKCHIQAASGKNTHCSCSDAEYKKTVTVNSDSIKHSL